MGILIAAILVILILAVLVGFTFGLFGLVVTLIVAGIVGWLADLIVPGRLPFGWVGNIAAGLLGAWLGTALLGFFGLGTFGPVIAGIAIIPAIIGAIILAFIASLIFKSTAGRTV